MARSSNSEVNKSEAIRQLYKQNPKMKVKNVVAALAERGIEVKPNMVYFVKGRMKRRGRKPGQKNAVAATPKSPLEVIMKVKNLAADLGGMKKLRELVAALSE